MATVIAFVLVVVVGLAVKGWVAPRFSEWVEGRSDDAAS
jgi:hypothetical protein